MMRLGFKEKQIDEMLRAKERKGGTIVWGSFMDFGPEPGEEWKDK